MKAYKGWEPDVWLENVYEIDGAYWKAQGIKGFLFDIDNTLEPYATKEPGEKLLAWLRALEAEGFQTGILSNAKAGRASLFAEKAGLRFVSHANKPSKRGFREMATQMGVKPEEMVMVGDQLYTDIWGGNRFGCTTILVTPIAPGKEPWFVLLKRVLEKPFLHFYKKRKKASRHV